MNEAAKKIVTREAHGAVDRLKESAQMGTDTDRIVDEAWEEFLRSRPEAAEWNCERYFAKIVADGLAQTVC